MRTRALLSILFFASVTSVAFAQSNRSFFASPVAGDVLGSGQSVSLKWFADQSSSGQVRISFWNVNTGQWSDIGYSDYKSGSFEWNVPASYGKTFRLRGITENGDVMYTSGFFSIQPPAAKTETQVPGVTSPINCTVHPNPASSLTRICVEDLPEGVPATVEIVNEIGNVVTTLYDATPDAELGLCCTLDCSKLPSGIYYAHIMNSIMGRAVKLSVAH